MKDTPKQRHCKRFILFLSHASCDVEATREDGEKETGIKLRPTGENPVYFCDYTYDYYISTLNKKQAAWWGFGRPPSVR
jgi:hypothetical protein